MLRKGYTDVAVIELSDTHHHQVGDRPSTVTWRNTATLMGQIVALLDSDALLLRSLHPDRSGQVWELVQESVRELFYGQCSQRDAADAIRRLGPESVESMAGEAVVTQERSGQAPRYYVACLNDRALPIEAQRKLICRHPCRQVATWTPITHRFCVGRLNSRGFYWGSPSKRRPTRERR